MRKLSDFREPPGAVNTLLSSSRDLELDDAAMFIDSIGIVDDTPSPVASDNRSPSSSPPPTHTNVLPIMMPSSSTGTPGNMSYVISTHHYQQPQYSTHISQHHHMPHHSLAHPEQFPPPDDVTSMLSSSAPPQFTFDFIPGSQLLGQQEARAVAGERKKPKNVMVVGSSLVAEATGPRGGKPRGVVALLPLLFARER